jgi:DivIVA domain-containing protein
MANLTPSDVRTVAFRKPPIGKRGYDEKEVDDFLDRVERTLVALGEEISSLRAQLGGAAAQPTHVYPVDVRTGGDDAVLAELDLIKTRLARIEATLVQGRHGGPARDPIFGP